jgi:hypothetical protein
MKNHSPKSVIPAQAGIQFFNALQISWIPACAGMTLFSETITREDLDKS